MAEFDSVIPAGQSGTLTAKMKTKTTQNGTVSKSIAVTTNATGSERLSLNFRFTSVSAISVLPRPQITLNGILGEQPSATLIFRRKDGEELEITGVDSSDERIGIAIKPVTEELMINRQKAVPGDVLVIATVAPGVPPGVGNGRIKIYTNHPDGSLVDVGTTLRMRAVIEANPAQVRLLLQEGNSSARTMLFRVQNNLRGRFKLIGAKPSNPAVFRVQLIDGDSTEQVHTVAVMLQDDIVPGSIESSLLESLVILTDNAAQEEVVVPVLIEPRALRRPGKPRPLE